TSREEEGARVQSGEIVAEIETDKAVVEVAAFGAGVLRKILVSAGEKAPVGTLIGVIAEPAEDIAAVLVSAPIPAGAGARAAGGPAAPAPAPAAPAAAQASPPADTTAAPPGRDRPVRRAAAAAARAVR